MLALIPFSLLLLGAGLVPLVARRQPRFVSQTAVSVSGFALLIWLVARTQIPFTQTIGNWADSGVISSFVWQVDLLNWQIIAALLLLLFAASLSKFNSPVEELKPFSYIFLLTAVSFTAIWAANLTSMIVGLTLLILPWIFAIWKQMTADYGRLLRYLMMVIAAICLIWYAVAITPLVDGWDLQGLPGSAVTAVAFAAVILAGIWPFSGWRLHIQDLPNTVTVFVFVVPTSIGGILLARLANSTEINVNVQLLLSLLALLGLFIGIRLAWANLKSTRMIAMAVLFAQAQLMLLAGIWVNGLATVAELRVLILAGGILFLAAEGPIRREFAWRAIAPIFALASFAALPLTAGFVGRSALYTAWIANGRFLFVLVLAILTIPLLTAVYLRFWPKSTPTEGDIATNPSPPELTLTDIGRDGGVILLSLGLISILGIGWGEIHLLAWLMILLSAVVGLVLPRFLGEAQQVQELFQQAFSLGSTKQLDRFKGIGRDLGTAVRDAANILEGEGGLVWLFILAILFFLLS